MLDRMAFLLFISGLLLFVTVGRGAPPAAAGASAATQARPPGVVPAVKESFHIYLLMGQSNMVGRDTRTLQTQVDNPRLLALDADDKWVVAREPMHAQVGRIAVGVGPGSSFGLEMLKADPELTIGLVPCAVGGTPLSRWVKGGDLYEQALRRAKAAEKSGVLAGVLWHQGESDSTGENNAQTYGTRLEKMFKDLRADLAAPHLPIVVGQLGEFLTTEKYPYVETVRGVLRRVPDAVPDTGYADSKGLTDQGDQLHFNAASATEFGKRYAEAMRKLVKGGPAPAATGKGGGASP